MKKVKNLMAVIASIILALPFTGFSQESGGTYIDSLGVQDSSYMQQDLVTGAEKTSSSNTGLIAAVIVVIVLVAVFVVLRKKKKK